MRWLSQALLMLSTSCATALPVVRVLDVPDAPTVPADGILFLGVPVHSGQLILSESPDATSFVFSLLQPEFTPFTHVATIIVEDGEPWVYDVAGEVKTLPLRSRMMDNVQGKMYRRPLYDYIAPNLHAEIYEPPPGADGKKIAAFVKQKFDEGAPFDAFFNYRDHEALYCTELVSLAVHAAGGPLIGPEPISGNPSLAKAIAWLEIPHPETLPAYRFASEEQYVGALGQFRSRASAWLYFEAKREIHRRFTPEQRLGFVVSMEETGKILLRPEVADFAIEASRLLERAPLTPEPQPNDPRLAAMVRELADKRFGPARPSATTR